MKKELKSYWEKTLKYLMQKERGEKDVNTVDPAVQCKEHWEREMASRNKARDCGKWKARNDNFLPWW